jgi:hypothetical protein
MDVVWSESVAGLPTSRHGCASLLGALVLLLASCEGRPLPLPDESDFGEDGSGSMESDSESSGDGDGNGDGDGDGDPGGETGTSCAQVVDSLVITNDTPPESVECIEQVLGNLTIGPTTKFGDLSMLSNLREVGGTIDVFGNSALTTLHGLDSLVSVEHLHVRRNHKLQDLHGLVSLTQVGSITVVNNEGLTSVAGLPSGLAPELLDIEDNDLLTNLDGLPVFESPSASDSIQIEIEGNPSLIDLGGLSDCCASQPASLLIVGNDALTDLGGLEGFVRLDALQLHDNFAVETLAGLENLIEVQTLDVRYDHCVGLTPSLASFSAAVSLSSVDVLQIQWVGSLTSLAGLENIPALDKLLVRNNAMLPWSLVDALILQTSPSVVDACGPDGPVCSPEPCATF